MKQIILITLSISLNIIAFGQFDIKEINESLAKVDDKLYASKYEVSNKQYAIFLTSLKQSGKTNLFNIAQIDTLKWRDKLDYNEPYIYYYHIHPAYQNYPVVNISYEAAKLYCEWLTEKYNSDPKRKFKKVIFRLPTEKEWIIAAQAGDSSAIYPWKGKELNNKIGQFMCNFTRELNDTIAFEGTHTGNADIIAPVSSFWANQFGLFNMSGNVAEMISEKGIVKGGSWKDKSEYMKIDMENKYDGNAQTFVGFRYFVEILEK